MSPVSVQGWSLASNMSELILNFLQSSADGETCVMMEALCLLPA